MFVAGYVYVNKNVNLYICKKRVRSQAHHNLCPLFFDCINVNVNVDVSVDVNVDKYRSVYKDKCSFNFIDVNVYCNVCIYANIYADVFVYVDILC